MSKNILFAALAALALVACNKNETTARGANKEGVDEVRELHRGEMSAVTSYDEALQRMGRAEWKPELQRLQQDHRAAADALRARIVALGGTPDATAKAWGSWADLVAASATALSDERGRDALKTGEKHGVDEYESALKKDKIDADTKNLIRDLLAKSREHVAALDRMK